MAYVQHNGRFENSQTGEIIYNPLEKFNFGEKLHFKIHRSTLAKTFWDLGSSKEKILALLINNTNERNNHIYFGEKELIDYFKCPDFQINERTVKKHFDSLLSNNFIKKINEGELMFNPQMIFSGKKEIYQDTEEMYRNNTFKAEKPKRKYKIKGITAFQKITEKTKVSKIQSEVKYNSHFAKIKRLFLDSIFTYSGNKKIAVLCQILCNIFEDDKYIIIERKKFKTDKATLNTVTQFLYKNELLFKSNTNNGVYAVNHEYISMSTLRKRLMLID